jgi:hypothetical protein
MAYLRVVFLNCAADCTMIGRSFARFRNASKRLWHEHWTGKRSRKECPIRRPPCGAAERIFLLALARQSRCVEGFDDFVTSIAAPTATGWNNRHRAGLVPNEDARLSSSQRIRHGHAPSAEFSALKFRQPIATPNSLWHRAT